MYIIICLCIIYLAPSFSTNISERYKKKTIQIFKHMEAFYGYILHRVCQKKLNNE